MFMNSRWIFLPLLLLTLLVSPGAAADVDWTEKKLGKIILKADRAARQKKWSRAIKYGEQMLAGSRQLDQKSDDRYINLLKNLNRYYENAGRLQEISAQVKEAYNLSKKHLGPTHETTMISRNFFYKNLIAAKDYGNAARLVEENLFIFENRKAEDYRIHHYLMQLYALYGITNQLKKEEATLLRLLSLNKRLFGDDDQDNRKIILNLARNYCRQKDFDKFEEIITANHLKYNCQYNLDK